MMIEKPKRYESEAFLRFVRTQPCVVCESANYGEVDAHHVETRGSGGSDLSAIPLCRMHHTEIHMVGVDTFARRHRVFYDQVKLQLLDKFIREGGCDANLAVDKAR
jgi:hypothetical protein